MSSDKLYSEIFEDYDKLKTKEERVNFLRKYDTPRFRAFFIAAFNKGVEFDVDVPPYRPAPEPAGLNYTYLDSEMDKLYRFVKNHPMRPTNLTREKQKQLLVVILESLHKDEAELLVQLINKKLKIKNLNAEIVKEAFPNISV